MTGLDLKRTILWVIFGTSLLFLWDKWQIYTGHPSLLMPSHAPPAAPVAAAPVGGAPGASGGVPSGGDAAAAATDRAVPQGNAGNAPGVAAPGAAAQTGAPSAPGAQGAQGAASPVRIESDVLQVDIDPLGGVVTRVELLKQTQTRDWKHTGLMALVNGDTPQAGVPVVLFEDDATRIYTAQSGLIRAANAPNHTTRFSVVDGPRALGDGDSSGGPGADSVALSLVAEGGGLKVTKTYVLHRGQYAIDVRHEVENTGPSPLAPAVYMQLVRDGTKPAGETGNYSTYTGPAMYTSTGKFQKISFGDLDKDKANYPHEASDGWIAMVQHYFVTAWVPAAEAPREYYTGKLDNGLYRIGTIVPLGTIAAGASASNTARLYAGPQDQGVLAQIAPGLDLVVDYGWLTIIAKPLFWLLQFLHKTVSNWGWAIILLTVVVKGAFYPLSAASYRSMAKMKDVAPRLQKIRELHGDDKQKQQLAMMELYKSEKINPVGGCLPIVVQMPVFISLYWVLLASVEMRNAPWILWVRDLAAPDSWFILPALMMGSMWVQYKLNPTPPDPVQAKVMAFMPLVFGAMMFFFPAGLVLYWTVNNLLSIAQQWAISKQFKSTKPVG